MYTMTMCYTQTAGALFTVRLFSTILIQQQDTVMTVVKDRKNKLAAAKHAHAHAAAAPRAGWHCIDTDDARLTHTTQSE